MTVFTETNTATGDTNVYAVDLPCGCSREYAEIGGDVVELRGDNCRYALTILDRAWREHQRETANGTPWQFRATFYASALRQHRNVIGDKLAAVAQ